MIITSTNRQPVRVVRSVTEQSAAELDTYRTVGEDFPRATISLRPSFGATIVEASETYAQKGPGRKPNSLTGQLLPIPETGTDGVELKVQGVDFMGTHLGYRALVLILDDPGHILASERAEYLRRMNKHSSKPAIPHVSLMRVDAFFMTSALRAWAEARMPHAIGLQPINSVPHAALEEELARAPKVLDRPKHDPHLERRVAGTVRTLGPDLIPDALIQSLRTRQHVDAHNQNSA